MRPEWRHLQWKSTIPPSHATSRRDPREIPIYGSFGIWTPDSGCGGTDGPHICSPGLSWGWFTWARKTEGMPKRWEVLTLRSPSFKLIYVPWGSLSSPAKFFSVWCPVLLQMSLSFALSSNLEVFPFHQFHLSSAFNCETTWDILLKFTEWLKEHLLRVIQ